MALATQCPHCQTTFRVAHDQLKLRAGIVRCGTCKQIFNGVEHLLPPDAIPPAGMPRHPAAAASGKIEPVQPPAVTPAHDGQHGGDMTFKPFQPIVTDTSATPETPSESPATLPSEPMPSPGIDLSLDQAEYEALEQLTQKHFMEAEQPWEDIPLKPSTAELPPIKMAAAENKAVVVETEILQPSLPAIEETAIPDFLLAGIEDHRQHPSLAIDTVSVSPADEPDEAENDFANEEEPDFVKRGRQLQRYKRPRQLLFGIGALLLLIGAMAQATYAFRNQIAARLPQTKPLLSAACSIIGCKIAWPEEIDALTIEASELQALPNNNSAFSLTLLLRNRGSSTEAWPSIQLTLNDENERAVARRIFTPREYLGSAAEMEKGFASNTEQSVKIFFTLAQLKASGYRVYLFYP